MNRLRNRKARAAFTLVELLSAMLAACVLSLSTTSLLFYGFRCWSKGISSLGQQRDAGVALDLMNRALRSASATNVLATPTQISVQLGGVIKTFTLANDSLVYDPNNASGGDEAVIIPSGLTAMQSTLQTNSIDVVLQLAGQAPIDGFATHVTFRN